MSKLIVTAPNQAEESYPCTEGEMQIGRSETSQIVLRAPQVSRQHTKIVSEGGEFLVMDLGSENGTLLNGTPLRPHERCLLREDDLLTIGPYRIRFSRRDERLEQSFNEITDSDILEVKLLKKVLHALDKETVPSLEALNGVAEGKKLLITDDLEAFVVGRDPMVDFPIEEYVVSRRHAKLLRRPEGITLQDLGSKNGTFVNNARITETCLHDGDRIAFGTIVCIFRNPRDVNLQAVGERMKEHRTQTQAQKAAAPAPKAETAPKDEAEAAAEITGSEVEKPADLDALAARAQAHDYPVPHAPIQRLRFSPFEIGLIWLGTVVFLTTVVLLVKLLS